MDLAVIEAGWPDIVAYIDRYSDNPPIDMERWFESYKRKHGGVEHMTDEEINDSLVVMLLVCNILEIDTTGRRKERTEEFIEYRCQSARQKNRKISSHNNRPVIKQMKSLAKVEAFHEMPVGMFTESIYGQEKLSISSLVHSLTFSNKDNNDVAQAMINAYGDSIAVRAQDPLFVDLFRTGLQLKWVLQSYKQAKSDFWSCVKMDSGYAATRTELQAATEKATAMEERNKALQSELDAAQLSIKRLQAEVAAFEKENKDIELLWANLKTEETKEEQPESASIDMESLNNVRALFVGGHKNLRKKLKKHLPDWTIVGDDFAKESVAKSNKVFFHPTDMSHSSFYRFRKYLPDRNRLKFVQGNNINILLPQLSEFCGLSQ